MRLELDSMSALAVGSGILVAGGGGDPRTSTRMAEITLAAEGPVEVVSLDDLDGEALLLPVGMVGAPTVLAEKLVNGGEGPALRDRMEALLGRPVRAMMCFEMGGVNAVLPIVWAARAGLPIVDADLMGRAFPELQMCTPTLYGITATPMAIADEKGNSAVINTIDNRWTETLARTLTIDMGCSAMIAIYPMTGKQVKEACVLNTISLLERIGATIREA